jgi:hypothetical protein
MKENIEENDIEDICTQSEGVMKEEGKEDAEDYFWT